MTEAILLFSPQGSLIKKLPHKTKGRVHWILQCLCLSCAVLGLAAIFYNKHLNGKPHFTSWHGLLGLFTVCVVGAQSLAAVPLIFHSLAKGWSLAKLKRYHAASGLITYLLGSASLLLGLCSAWFSASVKDYTWYLSALCPTLSALIIMNQVSNAYIAKKRLQSWQNSSYGQSVPMQGLPPKINLWVTRLNCSQFLLLHCLLGLFSFQETKMENKILRKKKKITSHMPDWSMHGGYCYLFFSWKFCWGWIIW